MSGGQREDPSPVLPLRVADGETWQRLIENVGNYVIHRWSATDAAVVRFRLGMGPPTVLGSYPARTVDGEVTFPGVPGGLDRLGVELDGNGAHFLLAGTVIDGLFFDITKPEPFPYVMVFDLPRYRGHSLADTPYAERMALLWQAGEELREANAWPSDWSAIQIMQRQELSSRTVVLRDLRAPMTKRPAAFVAPLR